jgi:hypothetical protein
VRFRERGRKERGKRWVAMGKDGFRADAVVVVVVVRLCDAREGKRWGVEDWFACARWREKETRL